MPLSHWPHGVSSFGIPVIPPGVSIPQRNGNVWFVDGIAGSDGNAGQAPDDAFLTIQRAIDFAGDGTGDTIFVFAGSYDENLVVTKDYLSIIGATLPGYAKPDIVPSTGKAMYAHAAQGLVLRHLRLYSDNDDVILNEGNGFLFQDCVFDGNLTAAKTALRLKGNATDDAFTASEGYVLNCLFRGHAVGLIFDTAAALVGVGSTDNQILSNVFQANTVDIATANTGVGLYSVQRALIAYNQFVDKNKAVYIDLTTTNGGGAALQTGVISGNYFAADAITAGNQVRMVGTGFTFPGNFTTVGVKDGSGLD